jgi:hypothetical protein
LLEAVTRYCNLGQIVMIRSKSATRYRHQRPVVYGMACTYAVHILAREDDRGLYGQGPTVTPTKYDTAYID